MLTRTPNRTYPIYRQQSPIFKFEVKHIAGDGRTGMGGNTCFAHQRAPSHHRSTSTGKHSLLRLSMESTQVQHECIPLSHPASRLMMVGRWKAAQRSSKTPPLESTSVLHVGAYTLIYFFISSSVRFTLNLRTKRRNVWFIDTYRQKWQQQGPRFSD